MALIKLGGIVTQISGKMGGTTFGTSASGAYAKNSGRPRKSITLAQRSKMALMGTTAQKWRALTDAQRAVYNAASPDYPYLNRVGESKFYSGYAIFGQLINNLTNVSIGTPPVPLPKFSFTPIVLEDESAPNDEGFFQFNSGQAAVSYNLFISRVSSKGVTAPYKNQFYMVTSVISSGGIVYLSYQSEFIAKWGVPPNAGKLYYRVDAVSLATGQIYKGLYNGVYSY